MIKELNVQKNMNVLNEIDNSPLESQNERNSEKRKRQIQTIRRHGDAKSGTIETPSEAVKIVTEAINSTHQPIKLEKTERKRLKAIHKSVDSFFVKNKLDRFNSETAI